jgi:Ring finger domain
MEAFEHNDLVSWSPSVECEHVFHHVCIKTWLLHHEGCPYCRVCVLSVDKRNEGMAHISTGSRGVSLGLRGKQTKRVKSWGKERLRELAVQRHQRLLSTYYCIKEGLITLDQPLCIRTSMDYDAESNLTSDHKTNRITDLSLSTMKRFLVSDVPPNEMIALRTHPKSIRSTSDVVVTITSPTSQHGGMDATADVLTDHADLDIETTMKEPVISDEVVTDRNDAV